MLRFQMFRVPVVVDGWFWLSAVFLGGGMSAHRSQDWVNVALWTMVMFISVLAHEFGHAWAGRHFGAKPAIKLHGFGGLTFLPGATFSRGQSMAVSAAGPAVGLLLGLLVFGTARAFPPKPIWAQVMISQALFINFIWTALNLLPIQPLDGGQILRELLGPARGRITSWIGGVLAVGLAIWAGRTGQIFTTIFLALLAYYNFRQIPLEGGVAKG